MSGLSHGCQLPAARARPLQPDSLRSSLPGPRTSGRRVAVLLTHTTSSSRRPSPGGEATSSQTSAGAPASSCSAGGRLARASTRKLSCGPCRSARALGTMHPGAVHRARALLPYLRAQSYLL